jgi:alpha-glucoside transport system permease protein
MSAVPAAVAPAAERTGRPAFRFRPSRAVLDIVLAVVAVFWLVPTIGLTIISLRPERLFQQSGWWTVFGAPAQLTLQNYSTLFSQGLVPGGVLDSLTTSIAITVPATLLVAIISSLAAYSLVFGKWRGREVVFLAVVALLVVPLQVALIPVVQMFRGFGSLSGFNPYGTLLGVVIFHVEAGRIDGAGQWTLFQRVVMPLSLPAAMSLAIFQFIWVWNDLLIALVFLGGNPHHPLTIFLYDQTRTLAANYWIISTGAMISILIPLIVFFSLQRYFVQGVLAGAVK